MTADLTRRRSLTRASAGAALGALWGCDSGDPHEISVLWSFVLNVPTANLVERFDAVDMSSPRVADKFALAGLTRGEATTVDAPTVEEAPIHLEHWTMGRAVGHIGMTVGRDDIRY